MTGSHRYLVLTVLQSTVAHWIITFSLIFGGCCSNAWALELATSENPHAGSLITFAQFLLVSIYGFWKHVTLAPRAVARQELLGEAAAKILELRSKKRAVERVYVAVEGTSSASHAFSDELAREIRVLSPKLTVRRVTITGHVKDELSHIDDLWNLNVPTNAVVLVDGEHLRGRASRVKWSYFVLLAFPREKVASLGSDRSLPAGSVLAVDISSPARPMIVSSTTQPLHPLTVLKTLLRIRLKKRSIPISQWAIQVALFLVTSLLNNAAFGYDVPMAVHIIFRSGGLVVNMLMGVLIYGRRYNVIQIVSVILVTLGVICTTLSASQPPANQASTFSPGAYFNGILILSLALIMSGFMGLTQDRAYAKYGRGHWQEAMFYLHFLALPGFGFVWRDLVTQIRAANASTRLEIGLPTFAMPYRASINETINVPFPGRSRSELWRCSLSIPSFYLPLLLNIVTQLFCVSGVHRLTSRVNSLTVTLVLVVRKAVSLGISVVLLKRGRGGGASFWIGAGLVLVGTMTYTASANSAHKGNKARNTNKNE